jgi:transcriptional regulator with GAF, ATPase, and Fis domain
MMELGMLDTDDDRVEVMPLPFARLEEVEREYIILALERTYWRVEGKFGAAELLGLNPNTLRSRMRKLGIRRPAAHA